MERFMVLQRLIYIEMKLLNEVQQSLPIQKK